MKCIKKPKKKNKNKTLAYSPWKDSECFIPRDCSLRISYHSEQSLSRTLIWKGLIFMEKLEMYCKQFGILLIKASISFKSQIIVIKDVKRTVVFVFANATSKQIESCAKYLFAESIGGDAA